MRIAVLLKPIRDIATNEWSIGSLDHYALSHALALRDATAGSVVAIALGPESAAAVLQRALASGADEAIHLQVENLDRRASLSVAREIYGVLAAEVFDLILGGQTSDDIETGTVGPMLAEMFDLPHVATVTKIEPDGDALLVSRDAIGSRQLLRVRTPAVLLVLSGRDVTQRYPTPRSLIAARKKPAQAIGVALGVSPLEIRWSEPRLPERTPEGEMLTGLAPADAAQRIAGWLRERGLAG